MDVAPYSIYLNIDGAGTKIGATTTTRRSTIYIDDNGTIDYSTVDALTPNSVTTTLRSGDTLNIAAGTYGNFSIQSDHVTSSLTIAGAGVTTIINAGTNQHALSITGVTSTAISGLVLQNASSVQSIYASTRMNFAYGGNNYADAIAPLGLSSNQMVYVGNADLDSVVVVSNDGDSVTSATGMGSVNYHLVLIDLGGSRATFLVPNSLFTSYAEANAAWGGFGITIDRFVTSTLSVSGGDYTYNSSAVAAAGVTLIGGLTTPAISRSSTGFAGLKLVNTGIATITNVTSTQNGYGIWFASGDGNTISDSILSSNTIYDVRQDTNATNTLDNVTFTRVSSTVTGAGPILVKYDARVRLLRQGGTAISGASASSTSGGGTVTSLGSTDGSGYTSYVSLDAHRITSGSSSLTNGGFNPYTLNAVGTNYFSSSTTATLSSPNQTVTLALWSNQSPTAPTSATGTSLATTSVTLGWTDNSDDEASFLVDYRSPGAGQSYPGTTGTITSGNSTSVSGLTPGQTYEFRVAAVNSNGTSTYATSSQFTLPAATPAAPTVTVLSSTSLSVDLDTNGNATSVQYALYSAAVGGYINASGTVTSTASWNTSSTWGTLTISNLTCNTSYSFLVTARNTVSVETATSSASTATTSACAASGGGGGGGGGGSVGGGGGVGGIGFVLPGTVTPAPIRLPPVVPVAPTSSPIVRETQPLAPPVFDLESRERLLQALGVTQNPGAENRSLVLVRQDAREFSVALSDVQANRFALFIAYGTSPETRRLGEGERRALIRDMLETMQRADLSVEDMQRLTMGEIPRMRNLAVERQQLPRVRQTFRALFGHDPNFQNPQENLAWNTLMYRIRFNRDLALEQQGIREFRSVFGRSPSTPFQWATVRVQGYVQR